MQVVWCLTNVAAGSSDQTRQVLEAVPYLINVILPGASEQLKVSHLHHQSLSV